MSTLRQLIEAVALRSAPGLLNLAALLLLAQSLDGGQYAVYSTVIATAGFLSSVLFGPVVNAIVLQYERENRDGKILVYQATVVYSLFIMALMIATMSALLYALRIIDIVWVAPVITSGIFNGLQEILRARLRLWLYGVAALMQGATFVGIVWLFIEHDTQSALPILLFALSNAAGAAVSLAFVRLRWKVLPRIEVFREIVRAGSFYTISNVSENGLYMGLRYMVLGLASPRDAGIFSFSIDVSQRFLGFVISAAAFTIVPIAFRERLNAGHNAFKSTLLNGAGWSLILAISAFIVILFASEFELVPALKSDLFDPIVFSIISVGVVINRLKKLVVDPVAMLAERSVLLAVGYAVAVPPTLIFGYLVINAGWGYGPATSYLLGYAISALATIFFVRHSGLRLH